MDCRLNLGNIVFGLSYHGDGHGQERKNNKDRRLFQSTVRNEIERHRGIVSKSTYENELTAYRSFMTFAGKYIRLCDLTADRMKAYERWLLNRNVKPNTSAAYMRSLRSIVNRLGMDGQTIFKNVRTTIGKAEKRAIQGEEIRKVMNLSLKKSFLAYARDLFIFSIMAMGIPFIDLAHLRKTDIRDGFIVYHRRKTGRPAKVFLEPCMKEIITRYSREDSPFLFPLLPDRPTEDSNRAYNNLLGKYNKALRRISLMTGLSHCITSYTARHTWATIAYSKGGSLAAISKALTHATPLTTQNYLKELDDMEIIEVNRLVLEEFYTKNK